MSLKADSKVTIKIPRPLYKKISQVIVNSGYNSVTDFVVYVLRDMMACRRIDPQDTYGPNELTQVKAHLRALGYLDDAGVNLNNSDNLSRDVQK
jgi:hypothetical protein